ncbi:PAS domain-containing protein [Rhizobiaceae bacterium]|nr:PAS domain-containing protein [Rhizobiaceae bacterium]
MSANPGKRAVCPVIGVGASAGGLEAFQSFVSGIRLGDGICYVLVQHLDPNHDSMLPELLAKHCAVPVEPLTGDTAVRPDVVLVVAPNTALRMVDGVVQPQPFETPRGVRRPIDDFFRSMGEDQRENCGCVVLSGTGTDGSFGLRLVKSSGGLALVQSVSNAKYSGMPAAALETGMADADLAASDLVQMVRSFFSGGEGYDPRRGTPPPPAFLTTVLGHVRRVTGHDLTRYKTATLGRRLLRRMQIVDARDGDAYLELLRDGEKEAHELFQDMLINVTQFFRDPELFDRLRTEVIPEIVKGKGPDDAIRIWCPGCSSGEEPYSIAMLLAEESARQDCRAKVRIFATDIDPVMVARVRAAEYPLSAANDVPPDLFDRYLMAKGDRYEVDPELRKMVNVSLHSVTRDPPFSRIDLIVCRNLLIYFTNKLQSRVITLFHQSLRPDGHLFIGPSENLSGHEALFKTAHSEGRLFRRINVRTPFITENDKDGGVRAIGLAAHRLSDDDERDVTLDEQIERSVRERYSLPHVVLDASGSVEQVSARTAPFLEIAGKPGAMRIGDVARGGLVEPIETLMAQLATSTADRLRAPSVAFEFEDEPRTVDLYLERLAEDRMLLVFSERITASSGVKDILIEDAGIVQTKRDERLRSLQHKLDDARTIARSAVAKFETSNEELKSSNEEMMSMNEELQSSNEELTAINDELQEKMRDLSAANSDIANFLEGARIPMIFLNADLTIRSFTPEARSIYSVDTGDEGRALSDISSSLDTEMLLDAARRVAGTLASEEFSMESKREGDGRSWLARVLPYRTETDQIRGSVLVFTDITEVRRVSRELDLAQDELRQRLEEMENLYAAAPVGMLVFDRNYRYLRTNAKLASIIGQSQEWITERSVAEVSPDATDFVKEQVDRVFRTAEAHVAPVIEYNDDNMNGALRVFQGHYYPVMHDGNVLEVGAVIVDLTEQREMQAELHRVMMELQHRVKNMLANVLTLVRQARRSPVGKEDALEVLSARLTSLTHTHDALTQTDWRSASLKSIVKSELLDVYGAERVTARGPDVMLGSRATLSIGMALHELATNAVKHGALSREEGTLEVRWSVLDEGDGRMFNLVWSENMGEGGSIKVAKDGEEGQGFGSRLIMTSIESALGGTVERRFVSSGLVCSISAPYEGIVAKRTGADA